MVRKYSIYTIGRRLSWQTIEKSLKYRIEYGTNWIVETNSPCRLADGLVYYRIYSTWSSKLGLSSIHICRHLNGICIIGSLNIDSDNNLAGKAYNALKEL